MIEEKHRKWAMEALENYCLVRASGKMRDIMRHRPEPKPYNPNKDDPRGTFIESGQPIVIEEPTPVDYAVKDYWLVMLTWSRLRAKKPHIAPLLDLAMHLYNHEPIHSFQVAVPFNPIKVPLSQAGDYTSFHAQCELDAFIDALAEQKAQENSPRGCAA